MRSVGLAGWQLCRHQLDLPEPQQQARCKAFTVCFTVYLTVGLPICVILCLTVCVTVCLTRMLDRMLVCAGLPKVVCGVQCDWVSYMQICAGQRGSKCPQDTPFNAHAQIVRLVSLFCWQTQLSL